MNVRLAHVLALIAFFLSGAAGLAYEIVWTRWLSIGLGHEMPSLLSVVAAFFGGFAIGAWALDGVISRSATPGRWYAWLEIVVAAWAVALSFALPWFNDLLPHWIGTDPSPVRHWMIAFGVPALALAPATIAMGGTLPAMDRLVARLRSDGHTVAGLYSINTLGAVIGTLTAVHFLLPVLGSHTSLYVLAVVNIVCAIIILYGPGRGEASRQAIEVDLAERPSDGRLMITLFLTGLFGIGYEVLGIRVMAQVLENTVFSFVSALVMYLIGTVIGAAIYQRFGRGRPYHLLLTYLLQATCLSFFIGILLLSSSGSIYESARDSFGGGFLGSLLGEMALGAMIFLLPAIIMGATFSHLAVGARQAAGGVGRALGLNTLGGALAPLLFGVVLLPMLGARNALIITAIGYLALLPRAPWHHYMPGMVAIVMLLLLPSSLVLVDPLPGGRIVQYREGVLASVAVVSGQPMIPSGAMADQSEFRTLKVNNRFRMGGTGPAFEERRQGHMPLLLHPSPRRALFLGIGTGNTLAAAAQHPGIELTGVELLPEVIDLLPAFSATNHDVQTRPDVRLLPGDARRFVRATDEQFDVIVADLFHPARDGSGLLYTREHFEAIKHCLADDGLFCQWLPLYQIDTDILRMVIRTFLDVYPNGTGWIGAFNTHTPILGLVGTAGGIPLHPAPLASRMTNPSLSTALAQADLDIDIKLHGCRLGNAEWLAAFAGEGPLNTDVHPRVVYAAPRFVYKQTASTTYGRLHDLLAIPRDAPATDETAATTAYRVARDIYLQGAMALSAGDGTAAIDAYLRSAEASTDFKLGYLMALNSAGQIARTDPARARTIVTRLAEADPNDLRAADLLRRLPRPRP